MNIYDEIDKINKELWHIIREEIPKIKASIGQGGSSDVSGDIEECKTDIASLESRLTELTQTVSKNEGILYANDANVKSLYSNLETAKTDIKALYSKYNTQQNSIANLQNNMSTAQGNISTLQTQMTAAQGDISSLQTRMNEAESDISTLEGTTTTLSTSVSTLEGDVSSLETLATKNEGDIASLSATVTTNSQTLSTLSTEFATVKNTVDTKIPVMESDIATLKASGGGGSGSSGGLTRELIYDRSSADPNINHNLPDGILSGNYFLMDCTQYKYLTVYAIMNTYNAQATACIENLQRDEFTIFSASNSFAAFSMAKISMPANKDRITFGVCFLYTFTASTGTFTRTQSLRDGKAYVYRIEGWK